MLKRWLLVGLLTLTACDARSLMGGNPPDGSSSSVTTTVDGGAEAICDGPPASYLCPIDPPSSSLLSMSALLAALPGRWVLCGHKSIFAVDGGDIGLEITSDNHWYKLFAAPGAATVRGAGPNEEGTWRAIDLLGDHVQVSFDIMGSGTIPTAPLFGSMLRTMHLNNNGVFKGDYVIDPSVPTGSVRCPPQVDPTRSGDCTLPAEGLVEHPCSPEVAIDRTLGIWSRCGGSMPGAPLHDGIELTADGTFYFLHRDPTGQLARGTSDAETGTATVAIAAGTCRADIYITTLAGVSIVSSTAHYQSTPRQLWIYTDPESGDPERYTFVSL